MWRSSRNTSGRNQFVWTHMCRWILRKFRRVPVTSWRRVKLCSFKNRILCALLLLWPILCKVLTLLWIQKMKKFWNFGRLWTFLKILWNIFIQWTKVVWLDFPIILLRRKWMSNLDWLISRVRGLCSESLWRKDSSNLANILESIEEKLGQTSLQGRNKPWITYTAIYSWSLFYIKLLRLHPFTSYCREFMGYYEGTTGECWWV